MFFLFFLALFFTSHLAFSSSEWNVCDDNFRIVTHIANNEQHCSNSSLESRANNAMKEYRIHISEDMIKKNESGVPLSVTEESVTIKSDGVNIIYHLPIYKNTNPNQNNRYINLVSLKKMVKTVENYPAFNPQFGFEPKLYIEGKEFSEFAQIPERVTEYGINNFILESKTLYDTIKPLPTAKSSNNSDEIVVPEEDDTEENTKDVQKNSDLKKITISTLFLACVGITASGASSYFLYRKLSKKKS